MYRVTVRILATPEDFWASVDFVDSSGKTHRREVRQDRAAPMRSNMLQALISAVGILTKPCGLTVIAQNDYLEAPMTQGWICAWKERGWTTTKGKKVQNWEQWNELEGLLRTGGHQVEEVRCQKA